MKSTEIRIRIDSNYETAFNWYRSFLDEEEKSISNAELMRRLAASRLFAFRQARYFSEKAEALLILDRQGQLHYWRSDDLVVNHSMERHGSRWCRITNSLDINAEKFRYLLEKAPKGNRTQTIKDLWLSHGQIIQSKRGGVHATAQDQEGLQSKILSSEVEGDRGRRHVVKRHALMSPDLLLRRDPRNQTGPGKSYLPLPERSHIRSAVSFPIPTMSCKITCLVDCAIYPDLNNMEPEELEALDPLVRDRLEYSPRHTQERDQIDLALRLSSDLRIKSKFQGMDELTGGAFAPGLRLDWVQAKSGVNSLIEHYKLWRNSHPKEADAIQNGIQNLEGMLASLNPEEPTGNRKVFAYTIQMPFVPVQGAMFEFRFPRPFFIPSKPSAKALCSLIEQECRGLAQTLIALRHELEFATDQDDVLMKLLHLHDTLKAMREKPNGNLTTNAVRDAVKESFSDTDPEYFVDHERLKEALTES